MRDIKASAAGSMVLTGSGYSDHTVRLWDLRTGGGCVRTMVGHTRVVWSVDMDGHCRTAVSGSVDETVKLWDLGSGRCMETYEFDDIVQDVVMHESRGCFLTSARSLADDGASSSIVTAWAVGSNKAIVQADMASSACVPNSCVNRLFASRDLSTVACFSIAIHQLGVCVWRS